MPSLTNQVSSEAPIRRFEPEHSFSVRTLEPGRADKDKNTRHARLSVLLCLIVVASFGVRITALAHWGTGAIESEGAEYATIAKNLRNGGGYVGMVSAGPQLVFPPLFPILIAGASFITHNYEWAGRMVALLLGSLLPLPVFGIASRLFNRRVGIVAALLVMLHPLLVNLSFSVLSEGPYTTLFLFAVYLVVRALNNSSIIWWSLVGGGFGLAYLTRQEAMAALAIAVLFAFFAIEGRLAIRTKRALATVAVFLLFAAPEVLFIYRATGKVKLEGKSAQFFALGKRILRAEANVPVDPPQWYKPDDEPFSTPNEEGWQTWQDKWAFYAVDDHLNRMGTAMRSHSEVLQETHVTLKDLFHLLGKGVRQNAPVLVEELSKRWLGAPFLPALALLGVLRRPWRGPQASVRRFVLAVAIAPVLATFSAFWSQDRYYFILVPFLIIWAANGLVELGLWMRSSFGAAGWRILARPVASELVIPSLFALAIILYPLKAVREPQFIFAEGSPSTRVEKDAGLWIARQQHPVRIMDLAIPLSFHANAEWVMFPYCDGDVALRFLDATRVDYIVLRRQMQFTKYYQQWVTQGIPDPRAELLHISSSADAEFVIYRWHRTG